MPYDKIAAQRARRELLKQTETPEDREIRLAKKREADRLYRTQSSEETKEHRKRKNAAYRANKLASLSNDELDKQRAKKRESSKRHRFNQSPEQRENRLLQKRVQGQRRRARRRDDVRSLARESYQRNAENIKAYQRQYRIDNPDKIKERNDRYRENNREKINAVDLKKYKRKYAESVQFNIRTKLRRRIRCAINYAKAIKSAKFIELLGCSYPELQQHIENQFTDGMTWDHIFSSEIHLDHIRPCSSFDLTDPEQQKECFHYTNLQPLWKLDNLKKGDKWDNPDQ